MIPTTDTWLLGGWIQVSHSNLRCLQNEELLADPSDTPQLLQPASGWAPDVALITAAIIPTYEEATQDARLSQNLAKPMIEMA
jgi:hypothetical protein